MNIQELLDAGFHEFKPSWDSWHQGFQLKVKDDIGIRYFVEVYHWIETPAIRMPEGWEAEVIYNDGPPFSPKHALKIQAYGGVDKWNSKDVIKWAEELWKRLKPEYYEKWQENQDASAAASRGRKQARR